MIGKDEWDMNWCWELSPPFVPMPRKKKIKSFYVIGALANKQIAKFSNDLEAEGYEAFSDWKSPGPEADSFLREYSKERGRSYKQILKSYAAQNTFDEKRKKRGVLL